jgi:uncharacterized protein YgbK (DUF1537 family)
VIGSIHVGIQADDLTGACDTAAPFAARGLETVVLLPDVPIPEPAPAVVALDTESRALPGPEARARARAAVARLRGAALLYKKLDSTLRGPIAAEVAGALEGADFGTALLAPAFPAQGRTVVGGWLLIGRQPADQSPIARDPAFPRTGASVPALLGRDGPHPVSLVPLATVRRGPDAVAARLGRALGVVVSDAETDEDLAVLREAASSPRLLLTGSAGLASAVAAGLRVKATRRPLRARRPLLVVAGTTHPTTQQQLERLAARGVPGTRLEAGLEAPAARDGADRFLAAPREPSLASADARDVMAARLAVAAREVLERRSGTRAATARRGTVLLTGGETALAVCRALEATGLVLAGELAPGLPCGRLLGGPFAGLAVITKAGGFGDAETLVRVLEACA